MRQCPACQKLFSEARARQAIPRTWLLHPRIQCPHCQTWLLYTRKHPEAELISLWLSVLIVGCVLSFWCRPFRQRYRPFLFVSIPLVLLLFPRTTILKVEGREEK